MYFLVLESAARAAFEVPKIRDSWFGWRVEIWKERRSLGVLGSYEKSCGVSEFLGAAWDSSVKQVTKFFASFAMCFFPLERWEHVEPEAY